MKSEWKLREELAEVGRRLYQAGYIRGVDGNLSIRLSHDEVLITPSRSAKGFLEPRDMVVINLEGELVAGDRQSSLETQFHLAVYQEREDVRAVVHAHPPRTIAFTVVGKTIPDNILPEILVLFPNGIPIVPYETPATAKLADSIRSYIRQCDVVVLSHHGTISVGGDIFEAWTRVEHVEACVEILSLAESFGGVIPLPSSKMYELEELRRKIIEARERNR